MKEIIIEADNLSVEFNIDNNNFVEKLFSVVPIGGVFVNNNTVKALDKISFKFYKGDRIGIQGHNGAGKTTLLRVLAGVYTETSGKVIRKGKVVSLLDIASGFDSDSSGFENIFLRGILFGLKKKEIEDKIDSIAAFSELGDFLNMPLRTYSSGMLLRLAFSIISHITADIIIMDEWLSVGDKGFQEKAIKRLNEMINQSSLLIIASHSEAVLEEVCTRRFNLKHGQIKEL